MRFPHNSDKLGSLYLSYVEIAELTVEDVAALDEAGSNRSTFFLTKDYLRIGATVIFVIVGALVLYCRMC